MISQDADLLEGWWPLSPSEVMQETSLMVF